MTRRQAKLCYVQDGKCYFSSLPKDQWKGDDWDDRPYEHNASPPYEYDFMVIVDSGRVSEPSQGFTNSPWSVDDINRGEAPWLIIDRNGNIPCAINAGITWKDFSLTMRKHGIEIYVKGGSKSDTKQK
jgi:hypothetical protein